MELFHRTNNNEVEILIKGEVDVSCAPSLREELFAVLEQAPQRIVVNLVDMTYIDSTGIGVFVGAHQKAQELGILFELASPSSNVKRVLDLLGISEEITIH